MGDRRTSTPSTASSFRAATASTSAILSTSSTTTSSRIVCSLTSGVPVVSFTLDRDRSFLFFETSPHFVMEPGCIQRLAHHHGPSMRLRAKIMTVQKIVIVSYHLPCQKLYSPISIRLLKCEDNIFVCPFWEHLFDRVKLTNTKLLFQLGNFWIFFN